jgi:hypothetical protein
MSDTVKIPADYTGPLLVTTKVADYTIEGAPDGEG